MDNGASSCHRFFDDDNGNVRIINDYKDEGRFLL